MEFELENENRKSRLEKAVNDPLTLALLEEGYSLSGSQVRHYCEDALNGDVDAERVLLEAHQKALFHQEEYAGIKPTREQIRRWRLDAHQ